MGNARVLAELGRDRVVTDLAEMANLGLESAIRAEQFTIENRQAAKELFVRVIPDSEQEIVCPDCQELISRTRIQFYLENRHALPRRCTTCEAQREKRWAKKRKS